MAEVSSSILFIAAGCLIAGLLVGWLLRGSRVKREKDAIHASWQEQLSAQSTEHDRIAEQNRGLMEQVSQYRASRQDADARTKELSDSLRDALQNREAMQAELREIRSNLEVTVKQRDRLKEEITTGGGNRTRDESLRDKDEKIFRLSRELESWQNRLPPLLEKFRERSLEAEQLEIELDTANARIAELLQNAAKTSETRVEPVEDAALAAELDASNEQYDDDVPLTDNEDAESEELQATSRSGEHTAIDTYLEKGAVDFDLSGISENEGTANGGIAEQTLTEIFEDESIVEQVDELLEAGETPTPDADTLMPETDDGREEDEESSNSQVNPEIAASAGNGYPQDDLQKIKGVGPAIEKTLNDLGIYSYDQIAEMNEVDIDRVARELRGFASRIYREDWIGQARMLQHERASQTH